MVSDRATPVMLGPAAFEPNAAASVQEVVSAIYARVLKRAPDAAGLANYSTALQSGQMSVQDIVRELVRSDEWQQRFATRRTPEEVLFAIYDCVLARTPDREGFKHVVAFGSDWSLIAESFISSREYSLKFGTEIVPGS